MQIFVGQKNSQREHRKVPDCYSTPNLCDISKSSQYTAQFREKSTKGNPTAEEKSINYL